MTYDLRYYQADLITAVRQAYAAKHRRVLAVASTGAGKTVTFAHLTHATAAKGNRIMIVAHRAMITSQISGALDVMNVRHGRIQPGHRMTDDAVQVGMIQTVWNRLAEIQRPHLLIVDEAHHAVAGAWSRLSEEWKGIHILGVTATPERLDGRGLGAAFDVMVEAPPMRELIERGFLARYRYLAPPADVDLSTVSTRHGDYDVSELAAAMDKPVITGSAVEHYRQYLDGKPAIAFCTTVAHAQHVAEQFRDAGYRAASVDGKMPDTDRNDRIRDIGNGGLNVLTSCELISEGVDVPSVQGAILLRPTKSLAMNLQQVGRVLRVKPDGSDAIILDHVGNFRQHGLPDAPRVWSLDSKRRKAKDASIAQCEVCYRVFASADKHAGICPRDQPTGCLLIPNEDEAEGGGNRNAPVVVDGTLAEVTLRPAPCAITDWSDGLDIITAPYKQIVKLAKTEAQLRELAKARGYNHKWVGRILGFRRQYSARPEPEEMPFVIAPDVPPETDGNLWKPPQSPRDEMEFLLS